MGKPQKRLETIAAFLRAESTMALATTDERGEPEVVPLFYILDGDLTLCFLSSAASRHCQNLLVRPAASATVYRHTESWKDICGVRMRGLVTVIDEPERRRALIQQYHERFQLGTVPRLAIRRCALYSFRPIFFRFIDNSKRFGYKIEATRE